MSNILITGTNRGIGLEFTIQYLQRGETVYAVCRDLARAEALVELQEDYPDLHLIECDISRPEDYSALVSRLSTTPIDIFINNAGAYGPRNAAFGSVNAQEWQEVFNVNTIAPLLLTQALIGNFRLGENCRLVYLTSKMGSIADNSSGGSYIYRSSKAALNQVVKSLAQDLASEGLVAVVLHPGWVQTDMGGPNALISTETSVNGMLKVIDGLSGRESGGFFNYDGNSIAW